jgi:DNA-binding MarR family transcriptional regulator
MGIEKVGLGDEMIGFATTRSDVFVRPECDDDLFQDSIKDSPMTSIAFDPQLLGVAEEIYKVRRKRDIQFEQFFGDGLFCEPAWDVLLDLYINNARQKSISVSSACLASAAPATTALRHISELVRRRLVIRYPHPDDRRVFVLQLSQLAVSVMEGLLNQHTKAKNAKGNQSAP